MKTKLFVLGFMATGGIVANVGAAVGNMFLLIAGSVVAIATGVIIKFGGAFDDADGS